MEKKIKIGSKEKLVCEYMRGKERNKENLIKFVWEGGKGNERVIYRLLKSGVIGKKENIDFLREVKIEIEKNKVVKNNYVVVKEMGL